MSCAKTHSATDLDNLRQGSGKWILNVIGEATATTTLPKSLICHTH